MKKTTVILFLLCTFFFEVPYVKAHSYEVKVIVDTDMALDDIRAIIMLFNSGVADIPLVALSDGVLAVDSGCEKAQQLMQRIGGSEVLTAMGRSLGKTAPPWRSWNENWDFPAAIGMSVPFDCVSAAEEIVRTLYSSDEQVVYLCLGPLTNLAGALMMAPDVESKISRVVYFGGVPGGKGHQGWNTERDADAAKVVFESGLAVYALDCGSTESLSFSKAFYGRIKKLGTPASDLLSNIHATHSLLSLVEQGHLSIWDELAVVYLSHPDLFTFTPMTGKEQVLCLSTYQKEEVIEAYLALLGYPGDLHLSPRELVMLESCPVDPSAFRQDVRSYVPEIVRKYGLEEWKVCLLTNELHRHLGVYSIIGAKMGVRARELLRAPIDTLEVISGAGKKPPLSYINDGVQVSTGASLGRGTITVNEGGIPKAVFIYGKQKLVLKMKPNIADQIKKDIASAVKQYGGENQEYFAHVRKIAMDYWLMLDRAEIFEETLQ